ENHVGGRGVVLVFSGSRTPAAIPGKAKVLTRTGDAIQFARGLFVAHAIDLIVVGPERLVFRIEIHADRIAQSDSVDLAVLAVAIHTDDSTDAKLAVEVEFLLGRHIVGLAQLDIELVVRAYPADPRGVII